MKSSSSPWREGNCANRVGRGFAFSPARRLHLSASRVSVFISPAFQTHSFGIFSSSASLGFCLLLLDIASAVLATTSGCDVWFRIALRRSVEDERDHSRFLA